MPMRRWHINWIGSGSASKQPATSLCSGKTDRGATHWVQYSNDGIYVDVDTSKCSFQRTPVYISSLSGTTSHWKSTGGSEVYSSTATGFRIYINSKNIKTQDANNWNWHINWMATGETSEPLTTTACAGHTNSGSTNWQQYSGDGIYVDVDSSPCGFTTTPAYVSSIVGKSNHWKSKGSSEIYSPSATGFRVYILSPGITPVQANSWGWHMNFMANAMPKVQCGGETVAGSTNWVQYSTDGIYVDVDT